MTNSEREFIEALERQLRFDFSPHGDLVRRKSGFTYFRGHEIYFTNRVRKSCTTVAYKIGSYEGEVHIKR